MEARIDHVVDARDTRPAWGITYRRYVDVKSSHVRVQADNLDSALAALAEYIGSNQYAVTAIYPEQQPNTPQASQDPAMSSQTITTDKLQAGDVIEHRRNGDRFTVDTVVTSRTDGRFHRPGDKTSESGMNITGHDIDGQPVRYLAAQSCPWRVIELAGR